MVETLSNLLRSVVALSPPDLVPVLYLSLSRLGPPQQGLELGVGDGVLLKAVAQATGKQAWGVVAVLVWGALQGRRGRGGERGRQGRLIGGGAWGADSGEGGRVAWAGLWGWKEGLGRWACRGSRTGALGLRLGTQGGGRAWGAKGRCGETASERGLRCWVFMVGEGWGWAGCGQRPPETDTQPRVSPPPLVPSTPRAAAGVCQGRGSREGRRGAGGREQPQHPETHAAPACAHRCRCLHQVPRHRPAGRQRCECGGVAARVREASGHTLLCGRALRACLGGDLLLRFQPGTAAAM